MLAFTRRPLRTWLQCTLICASAITPAACQPTRPPADPEVARLLENLSDIDPDEVDVADRPRLYRGRVPSGETAGYIVMMRDHLRHRGFDALWLPEERRFALVRTSEPPVMEWHTSFD